MLGKINGLSQFQQGKIEIKWGFFLKTWMNHGLDDTVTRFLSLLSRSPIVFTKYYLIREWRSRSSFNAVSCGQNILIAYQCASAPGLEFPIEGKACLPRHVSYFSTTVRFPLWTNDSSFSGWIDWNFTTRASFGTRYKYKKLQAKLLIQCHG